jgi:hypothetical protein
MPTSRFFLPVKKLSQKIWTPRGHSPIKPPTGIYYSPQENALMDEPAVR